MKTKRLLTLAILALFLLRCVPTGNWTIPLSPEDCTDGPGDDMLTFSLNEKEGALMTEGLSYLVSFADGIGVQAPVTFIDQNTVFFAFPAAASVDDCTSFGGPVSISSS